jgi:hypothetical protein
VTIMLMRIFLVRPGFMVTPVLGERRLGCGQVHTAGLGMEDQWVRKHRAIGSPMPGCVAWLRGRCRSTWFRVWFRAARTFCASSSRADTARTRRRCIRPALAESYPYKPNNRVCRCPASLPRLIAFPNPAATDARTLVKRRPDAVHCRDEPAATGLCQQVPNALLIIASSQARALHRARHQVSCGTKRGRSWPERSARRSDSSRPA